MDTETITTIQTTPATLVISPNRKQIRAIERLTLRAWHSLETHNYDGWGIRYSNGYTRRANSVIPLFHSKLDIAEKIAHCEEFYSARNLPTVFKINEAVRPENLDEILENSGYRMDALTSVQTLDLTTFPHVMNPAVHITTSLQDWWLHDFINLNGINRKHFSTMRRMLLDTQPRTIYASMRVNDETYALGLGILDGEWIGLFDIITDYRFRGRGLATTLVSQLLSDAKQLGARNAYLQVMVGNDAATHLYHRLGFREMYTYWYRSK